MLHSESKLSGALFKGKSNFPAGNPIVDSYIKGQQYKVYTDLFVLALPRQISIEPLYRFLQKLDAAAIVPFTKTQ